MIIGRVYVIEVDLQIEVVGHLEVIVEEIGLEIGPNRPENGINLPGKDHVRPKNGRDLVLEIVNTRSININQNIVNHPRSSLFCFVNFYSLDEELKVNVYNKYDSDSKERKKIITKTVTNYYIINTITGFSFDQCRLLLLLVSRLNLE